jgi:hypothetical protein
MLYKITDKEISVIVKKAQSTIARWKKDNPKLYEAVYRGCLQMKGEAK